MLLELLTPLIIAAEPVRIDVPEGKYDHETQVMVYKNVPKADSFEVAQIRQATFNGIRTFDFQGNPRDADND